MTTQEALDYFGSPTAMAKALGVTYPYIAAMKKTGVIPELRQYQIELGTHGVLKADTNPRKDLGGEG